MQVGKWFTLLDKLLTFVGYDKDVDSGLWQIVIQTQPKIRFRFALNESINKTGLFMPLGKIPQQRKNMILFQVLYHQFRACSDMPFHIQFSEQRNVLFAFLKSFLFFPLIPQQPQPHISNAPNASIHSSSKRHSQIKRCLMI